MSHAQRLSLAAPPLLVLIRLMVTKEISYDKLQERLVAAGQQHVLKFYAELPQEEKASLLQQLSQIPIDNLREYFEEATQASPLKQTKLIPLDKKSVFVRDSDEALRKEWDGLGFKAIKEDKVAVVTLAGGQGTRLGSARPKGCFNIGLPSQKSLFQLQAERVQRLKVLTGTQVLWYIMTSAPTHRDTVDFFESNNFFGLDSSKIRFFQQGFLPAFDMEGKVMLQTKGSVSQ